MFKSFWMKAWSSVPSRSPSKLPSHPSRSCFPSHPPAFPSHSPSCTVGGANMLVTSFSIRWNRPNGKVCSMQINHIWDKRSSCKYNNVGGVKNTVKIICAFKISKIFYINYLCFLRLWVLLRKKNRILRIEIKSKTCTVLFNFKWNLSIKCNTHIKNTFKT